METINVSCLNKDRISISLLTPLQGDLKILTPENYDKLKNEILTDGFSFAVHVWESKDDAQIYILDGHQRVAALKKMREEGYTVPQIPVVFVEANDINHAKRKVLAAASTYGTFNQQGAETFIQSIAGLDLNFIESNISMPEVDFSQMQFEQKVVEVSAHERTITNENHVDDSEEKIIDLLPNINTQNIKLGDIFYLGRHRLICGDSTNLNHVNKLISDQVIDLVYTDPPYGINESAVKRRNRSGLDVSNHHLVDFIDDSVSYAKDAFKICSDKNIKKQIWWGANYYCHSLPESPSWIVWDKRVEDKMTDTNSDCELAWYIGGKKSVRIFRHLWKGLIKGSEHGQRRVHPTQKPVALAEWCFDFMGDSKNVLDLFTGSGSTLIACEKQGKYFFGVELEPVYVATILERWQNYTGLKAAREDGKLWDDIKSS